MRGGSDITANSTRSGYGYARDRYRTNVPVVSSSAMFEGPWPIVFLIVVIIVYTIAKVRRLMRQSDEEWRQVDKSKLREWQDDD